MGTTAHLTASQEMMSQVSTETQTALRGKVALVTGASRGIGRGIAVALGELGGTVYIVARTGEGLAETAKLVRAAGGKCIERQVDLNDDSAFASLWQELEPIALDLVVNCAYSAVDALKTNWRTPSWQKSTDGKTENEHPGAFWDVVNGVGLRGVYVGSVYALRHFAAHDDGTPRTLVNVSSAGGLISIFDAAYCAGKSGVDRLTSELALDAPPNVTVLTYYPGAVSTEKFSEILNNPKNKMPVWNAESPLFVGRALASACARPRLVREMHGKIVVTAELAKKVGAVDEKGLRPVSFRSLRYLVLAANPKLADTLWIHLVPDVHIPLWIIQTFVGSIKLW